MKLYLVETNSFQAYVVANDPTTAANTFSNWLEKENYGYLNDRVVKNIRLIAATGCKPNSAIYAADMLLFGNNGNEE